MTIKNYIIIDRDMRHDSMANLKIIAGSKPGRTMICTTQNKA